MSFGGGSQRTNNNITENTSAQQTLNRNANDRVAEYSQQNPWSEQSPFLLGGFNAAANLLQNPGYTGPMAADRSRFTDAGLAATAGASQAANNGAIMFDRAAARGNFAGQASLGGLASILGEATRNAGDVVSDAHATAGALADDRHTNAMIDSVGRDIRRSLGETIPVLNANAVAGGNMNSSRTGVAEGIAKRGAIDAMANAAAGMRGTLANALRGDILAQRMGGGQLGLGATGQLANMNQLGLGAAEGANNLRSGAANMLLNAGALDTADRDRMIQGEVARSQMPWMNLQNYWNIVGGNSWGSNGMGIRNSRSNENSSGTETGTRNATERGRSSGFNFGLRL